MDTQITLRLPSDLARRLARHARARGAKKSQLVREAVADYLARQEGETSEQVWERVKRYQGIVAGDYDAVLADPIARQIYEHNFRD